MDAGYGGRAEAQRLLEIADKRLVARDLVGSKRFAERALESDPLLDDVDQILAVVDVLLASQRRINNQPDWYSILQLPHPSSTSSASVDHGIDIKIKYRHLALLLDPNRNKFLYADAALRAVSEAYAFLSDPAKKSLFDAELPRNDPPVSVPAPVDLSFWTSCPACCHVFEYERAYIDRTLRCQICMRPFHASEMAAKPPIVQGTDMYYCAWGFPGSGFPNSKAACVTQFGKDWKPFHPVSPWSQNQRDVLNETPLNAVPVNVAVGNPSADAVKANKRSLPMRNKKVVAKKRVGNYEKKIALFGETDSDNELLDAGGVAGADTGASEGDGITNFVIDLEATEDLLSNLRDLPFV
ncbi:hypothetical protein KSP39_PZI016986 [Platanthera zijinensis]|uniref:J domain-containing protein n=1 Tax=Platanthera zijinensis TaxID=2320716 RepID=A0AAP0G0L5_9ASPA